MVATRPILSPSFKGSLAPAKIRRVVVEVSSEAGSSGKSPRAHDGAGRSLAKGSGKAS
jgi:hypothetical protein